MSERKLLTAEDRIAESQIEIDLPNGTFVIARKIDISVMLFEGLIPMPLLEAVQRMIKLEETTPLATPVDKLKAMMGEDGKPILDMLRRHACMVCLKPVVAMPTPDGTVAPGTLPADRFDATELLTIWTATAITPKVSAAQAERFRAGTSPQHDPAPPAGDAVQPAAQPLVVPEFIGL